MTVSKLGFLFSQKQRIKLLILTFLLFIGMLFEFLSIGILLPVLNIALKGESSTISVILEYMNFKNPSEGFLVNFVVLVSFIIYTFKFIFLIFLNNKNYNFLNSFNASISNKLYKKYLYNDFNFHIKTNSSYILKNIITEINSLRSLLEASLILVLECLIFIGIVAFLFFIQPIAALTVFSFFSFSFIIFHLIFKNKVKRWGVQRQELDNKISKNLLETFGGIAEIKIFRQENLFFKKFNKEVWSKAKIGSKYDIISQLPKYYLEYLTIISVLGLLIFLNLLNIDRNEIITTLGIFAAASFKIIPSVNKIIFSSQKIKFNYPSLSIIYNELSNDDYSIIQKYNNQEKAKIDLKNIYFKNVSFNYPSCENVLENMNIKISSGKIIGIVGKSGEGKSTFVNLLSGLLTPVLGEIQINNNEIKGNLIELGILGFVPQSPFLLDLSIRDNICFGNNFDETKYREAVNQAQLSDFLDSLHDKDDTIVGERGVMISGGQRQRIAIARALYNDSQIIIFDEPTSSLDSSTEMDLLKSINKLKHNKTIIIISHSNTIRKFCNEVYEISKKSISKII